LPARITQGGEANQVSFDSGKEGMYILSRKCPRGDAFKLLGVAFDCKLIMSDTVERLAKTCQWKLKAVLRTSRFNSGAALKNLYKSQIFPLLNAGQVRSTMPAVLLSAYWMMFNKELQRRLVLAK
jgi:hypothetical protein